GARKGVERLLEGLAALQVEVVRRLVEHQEVRAGGHDQRQREPAPLAAGERGDRLLVRLPAGEEEAAEQVLRLRPREPGRTLRAIQHAAALVELDLVLREVGRDPPMAEAYRAFGLFAEAEHGLERRRLAGAVRPDEPDVLAAFEREGRVGQQSLVAGSHAQAVRLDHRSAAARRLEEVEAERTALAGQELQLSAGVRALGLE